MFVCVIFHHKLNPVPRLIGVHFAIHFVQSMQDSDPNCAWKRQETCKKFIEVYKRHGARPIETSHLQVRGGQEIFYGDCTGQIVNIDNPRGGEGGERESLCLRYDLTVSSFSTFYDSCFVGIIHAPVPHVPTYYVHIMYIIMYLTYAHT